jgi:hypothetical protein
MLVLPTPFSPHKKTNVELLRAIFFEVKLRKFSKISFVILIFCKVINYRIATGLKIHASALLLDVEVKFAPALLQK